MGNEIKTDGALALDGRGFKVITIQATDRPEAVKLRVAAYARVSSSSDDQMNSFAAQNRYYSTLIASKENWKMVDIYADAGASGTSIEKRPDFRRLLADCHRGMIDRILVKSISRFARNTTECLQTIRELKSIGVSVYFEEQKLDTDKMSGEFLTAVFASMAQKESQTISDNMRWGVQARMKAGTYLPSSQPFGYSLINKTIVVNDTQAGFVRRIFSMYLNGANTDEIARYMNVMKQKHPELDRVWTHHKITIILKNEKYIGDSLWQKTYTSDTLPFRRYLNRNQREKYYATETHPAILDRETFMLAQRLLERRRKESQENSAGPVNPFQRKLYCGCCGKSLRQKNAPTLAHFACRTHDANQSACPITPILRSEITGAFLRMYYKLKHQGKPLLKRMLHDLQTVRERQMLWSPDIIDLNKQISSLYSQNQLLADMKKNGLVDPDIFISRSNELGEQLRAAKLQKDRVLSAESDDTIPRTRELMETLEAGPELLTSFDAELFGELVERITVESNERVRFRLTNGLELPEKIERTMR